MHTRYFRKKDPDCRPEEIEWVEMSGKEYYRFVTDPRNKNRCFHDMGDVVLECTEAEYVRFKVEDDHSKYILEQEEDWVTVSLNELEDQGKYSGEEIIPAETEDVSDLAIRSIQRDALRKAVQMLSDDDYRIIMLKYHPQYAMTEAKIGALFGLSQSGISRRLKAIKISLKKFVIEFEKSSQ